MAITISGNGIVEANLADNAVTLAKMASGTDGEILTYDASGNPTAVSVGTDGQVLTSTGAGSPPAFETAAAGGITEADTWRITTSFAGSATPITSNWERDDDGGNGLLGTGMTQASGIFTFPSTGFWVVSFVATTALNGQSRTGTNIIKYSSDSGSTYTAVAQGKFSTSSTARDDTAYTQKIFDITNISTTRLRFDISIYDTAHTTIGQSTANTTFVTFIKLGDT